MDIFLYPSNSLFVKIVYAYMLYTLLWRGIRLPWLNSLPFLAPTPSRSFIARDRTLMNHACKRVLSEKGKYLSYRFVWENTSLHNFLLFHLRSHIKNSCFVFHQGFQTLRNNKSTQPLSFLSWCLEPMTKHSHSFLIYYIENVNTTRKHIRSYLKQKHVSCISFLGIENLQRRCSPIPSGWCSKNGCASWRSSREWCCRDRQTSSTLKSYKRCNEPRCFVYSSSGVE